MVHFGKQEDINGWNTESVKLWVKYTKCGGSPARRIEGLLNIVPSEYWLDIREALALENPGLIEYFELAVLSQARKRYDAENGLIDIKEMLTHSPF